MPPSSPPGRKPQDPPRRTFGAGAGWPVIGIFLILAFGFVAEARAFLMPATLAMLLFFVFVPFRRVMARIGIGPGWSAGIVSLGLVAAVLGLGYALWSPVSSLIANSDTIGAQVERRYDEIRESFRGLEKATARIDELAEGAATATSSPAPGDATPATPATVGVAPDPADTAAGAPQPITVQVEPQNGPGMLRQALTLGPEIVSQIVFTLVLLC